MSLAEAREQALANRKLARAGGDPLAEKHRAVGIPTFAEATARVWTIPASRMKAGREHRVPLCGRAPEILDVARTLNDKRMLRLLARHGIEAVPHGFRSSFRDWAAEETDHPREVIEVALAHVVQNKVEAAYARSDLFERRRRLMDDWSDYLNGRVGR